METIKASASRKKDGWAPTLEYQNGGRVISAERCGTLQSAIREADAMIRCMDDYPDAFTHNHPAPNQVIDLSNDQSNGATIELLAAASHNLLDGGGPARKTPKP